MEGTQIGGIVIVILAVNYALKKAGVNTRWLPLIALLLGVAGTYLFGGVDFVGTLAGVLLGLSTAGGYDLLKKTILGK